MTNLLKRKQIWILLLCLLMLCMSGPVTRAEDAASDSEAQTAIAEDLTKFCTISTSVSTRYAASRVTDDNTQSYQGLNEGQSITISWTDGTPVASVWVAFYKNPEGPYRIRQFDGNGVAITESRETVPYINRLFPVESETRSVTVFAETGVRISSLYAYGEGSVPDYHSWEPTPDKLDYLVIAMHPDDDVLFMGALIPMYTVEQGRAGTIFYTASDWRVRKDEAQNGAWIMGLRTYPIFGTFQDIPPKLRAESGNKFRKADVAKYLVGILRKYKPEVVFSHDLNGEYGHWQHIELAKAVQMAVPLAADPTYDPKTVESYGTWEVKKLYLHLYPDNPIHLPVTEPLTRMDGRTPVEIAAEAFECHQSQLPSRHAVRNEGVYSLSDFGLAYTTVGLDTEGVNDPFEHIAEDALHTHPTPTPEPTPTPAPTDTPTPVPTPSPTLEPVSSDTPAPLPSEAPLETESATAVPAAPSAERGNESASSWLLFGLFALPAIAILAVGFYSKEWWLKILLWLLSLALLGGSLYFMLRPSQSIAETEPEPADTEPALNESRDAVTEPQPDDLSMRLVFTDETLLDPQVFSRYPMLQTLDLRDCTSVDETYYESVRNYVPEGCEILWSVPLTDGRFDCTSTALVLPRLGVSDVPLLSYFPNLKSVDASGCGAFDTLLSLHEEMPDLSLRFTLPVGDQILTMEDTVLKVTGEPDLDLLSEMLPFFPLLSEIDLSASEAAPEDAKQFRNSNPDRTVRYTVPIGQKRYDADLRSLDLAGAGSVTGYELIAAIPSFSALESIDLNGTEISWEDIAQLIRAFPNLNCDYTASFSEESYPRATQTLDLRESDLSDMDLVSLVSLFPDLRTLYLPDAVLSEDIVTAIETAYPDLLVVRIIDVFGRQLSNDITELDLSGESLSLTAVQDALSRLPNLGTLTVCGCGLKTDEMQKLAKQHPDCKFIWDVQIGGYSLRTDAAAFSTNLGLPESAKKPGRLKAGDLKELQFCTELVALDLGGNALTSEDLKVLSFLPHLRVLMLGNNKITDISALSQLTELEYLELYGNRISDLSPLAELPLLSDLNIANTHLKNLEPVKQLVHLKRLWFSLNNLSSSQNKEIMAALPDTLCNYSAKAEAGGGWRDTERYPWACSFFLPVSETDSKESFPDSTPNP